MRGAAVVLKARYLEEVQPYLAIGVRPLIAMAHTLWRQKRPFELYYKAKIRAQAAFIPELAAMPWSKYVHFHFSDENRLSDVG